MVIQTKGFQGTIFKRAKVITNDRNNDPFIVGIKCDIWVPVLVTPRFVRLRGVIGDELEQVVHIEGKKKEPLIVGLLSNSIPDKVEIELKEVEKGRTYSLRIKSRADKEKKYIGTIKLSTNYEEKQTLLIQVFGYIRPSLSISPKIVIFKPFTMKQLKGVDKSERPRRSIIIYLNKGDDLRVESAKSENSLFTFSLKEIEKGKRIQVTVEPIFGKLARGVNQDRLKIVTNQSTHRVVTVPIRLEIF